MPRGTGRLDEAALQGRTWTPSQADVFLWFDAADLSTISSASSLVSQWRDKSGKGNHVSASGTEPTLVHSAFNGRSTLRFGGSQYLENTSIIGTTAAVTYVTAASFNSASGDGGLIDISFNTSTNDGPMLFKEAGVLTFRSDGAGNDSTISAIAGNAIFTGGTTGIFGTNGFIVLNGGAVITGASGTGPARNTVRIGTLWQGFYPLTGDIHEIIAFNSVLSQRDRQIGEGYLAWKWWGSQNTLPASHPYKNSPPLIGV